MSTAAQDDPYLLLMPGPRSLSPARVMGPLVCHEHGTSSSSGCGPC